jgi:hypothetical protein
MKTAKVLGAVLLVLLALWGFGRFFLSQLGRPRAPQPAGVVSAAPPGFQIVRHGELTPAGAADALQAVVSAAGPGGKVGIRFQQRGADVYWLADTGADTLEERLAGASGTRVQTIWHGHLAERLQWARSHGDLSVPGLAEPARKNLYH